MQINLTPDYSLLVILAIFLANYWVVKRFFIKPVNDVITTREGEIKGAEKLFEEALAKFNAAAQQMELRLQETKRQASQVRESHRTEAMKRRAEALEKAREEAAKYVAEATSTLDTDVVTARERIAAESEALARLAAERILGRRLA